MVSGRNYEHRDFESQGVDVAWGLKLIRRVISDRETSLSLQRNLELKALFMTFILNIRSSPL